jgi:hypothetical protein
MSGGNLLAPPDADFEGPSTDWTWEFGPFATPTASGPLAILVGGAYAGAQCAGKEAGSTAITSNVGLRFVSPPVACTPGTWYAGGFAYFNSAAIRQSPGVRLIFYSSAMVFTGSDGGGAAAIAASTWETRQFAVQAPAGAAFMRLAVEGAGANSQSAVNAARLAVDSAWIIEGVTARSTLTVSGAAQGTAASPAAAADLLVTDGTARGLMTARASAAADTAITGGAIPFVEAVPLDRPVPQTWVEAAVGLPTTQEPNRHQWTRLDVDGRCVREIEWEEGREKSLDEIEPATATVVMSDPVGVLDPSNTQSPLWQGSAPGVDFGTRVRIREWSQDPATYDELAAGFSSYTDLAVAGPATYGQLQPAVEAVPFAGFVERVEPHYDLTNSTATLEMTDWQAILAEVSLPPSAIFADVLTRSTVRHAWPLSSSSTTIKAAVGGVDGTWNAAPDTGNPVAPFDTAPSTTVLAGAPEGTITGVDFSGEWYLALWFTPADSSGTTGAPPLLRLRTAAGTDDIRFYVDSTVRDIATMDSTQLFFNSFGPYYDHPHLLEVWTYQGRVRASIDRNMLLTGQLWGRDLGPVRAFTTIGLAGVLPDPNIAGNPNGFMNGQLSWLIVSDPVPASGINPRNPGPDMWELGRRPWVETTAERVQRVTTLAGLPATIEPGGTWPTCAPATFEGSVLDHITRAAAGDRAVVSTTDSGQPYYRPRPGPADAPVVWFDTAGSVGVPVLDIGQLYGIDRYATRVEVTLGDGSIVTQVDPDSERRARSLPVATLLGDPDDAVDLATEILTERRVPRLLITSVRLQGRRLTVPWEATQLRPGDVVGVIARPPGRPELVQVSVVERVRHRQGQDRSWSIEYGLDRLVQYLTWQQVIDAYASWTALLAAKATWADVLLAASPTPPGA